MHRFIVSYLNFSVVSLLHPFFHNYASTVCEGDPQLKARGSVLYWVHRIKSWKRLTQCRRLCWNCPRCSKRRQAANCGKERSNRGGAGSILHVISDQFCISCQVGISVWASLNFLFYGSYSLLAHLFSISSGAEYGALYLMDCFSTLLCFL